MPQDDTFTTPTTPTTPAPAIPPVQDDSSSSDQSFIDPTNTLVQASPTPEVAAPEGSIEETSIPPVPVDTPAPDYPMPSSNITVPSPDAAVTPDPELIAEEESSATFDASDIRTEIASKINNSRNVLVALSSDPSVDELSAAIGITLYLDRLGKRATAIYSGSTPNALEFLKPEETFESTADTLQDFVIALNKEKADHLRYKLDGDYVKVYITPYRHRISEEDLEFSYGDYNVDLVLALDVANGIDLDSALREHGRIMHDAVIINITTGNPGKFGEVEWSDKTSSSVSEMLATLLYDYGGSDPIAKDEATAYLTGIVAATNRFANAKTTPATMRLCSKLMESGANQQLISKNITPDIDNELLNFTAISKHGAPSDGDPTKLDIEHDYELNDEESPTTPDDKPAEIDADVTKKEHTLLDDLKAAEQSLAEASAETVPDDNSAALEIDSNASLDDMPNLTDEAIAAESVEPSKASPAQSTEPTLPTPVESSETTSVESPEATSAEPIYSAPEEGENPALANAPTVPENPEINGVPEINYTPAADAEILPPPPAPPIELSSDLPTSVPDLETPEPTPAADTSAPTSLGAQPAMQDQVYRPQAADPSAFKIPGM